MAVLCVGQAVADIVVRPVSRLPVSGRADLVEELDLLSGGCAANTAAVLAKLGVETRLAAVIGQDILGDAVLADLKAAGVRLDAVVREATAPTTAALVAGGPERRSVVPVPQRWNRPAGEPSPSRRRVDERLHRCMWAAP